MRGSLSLAAIPTVRYELPEDAPIHQGAEQIFLHLDDRGFVPFHPVLAEKFGHKAAIFVGMALYWTRHSLRNHPERGGWFFMSLQQWKSAIGLTRTEQASVRELLMGEGVLEEMLVGRPAVLNYRLNVPALAKALAMRGKGQKLTWDLASSWFKGCKVYYKPLADVAGSIAGGLYLAYLLQRHRECLKLGQLTDGAIPVSQDEISTALVLGPKVQRNARERLKKAGFINEVGIGGALVRINFDAILLCLRGQSIKPLPRKADADKATPAASTKAAPSNSAPATNQTLDLSGLSFAFSQATLGLSATPPAPRPRDLLLSFLNDDLVPHKPVEIRQAGATSSISEQPAKSEQISNASKELAKSFSDKGSEGGAKESFAVSCKQEPDSLDETCRLDLPFPAINIQRTSIQSTTTSPVNTSSTADVQAGEGGKSSSSDKLNAGLASGLIFPTWIEKSLHASLSKVLAKFPLEQQQQALDEMEGANRRFHKVKSPVAWLNSVVKKYRDGECIWAYAPVIAAERIELAKQADAQQAQKEASLKAFHEGSANAVANPVRVAVEGNGPLGKEAARAKLLALRNERAAMIGKAKK